MVQIQGELFPFIYYRTYYIHIFFGCRVLIVIPGTVCIRMSSQSSSTGVFSRSSPVILSSKFFALKSFLNRYDALVWVNTLFGGDNKPLFHLAYQSGRVTYSKTGNFTDNQIFLRTSPIYRCKYIVTIYLGQNMHIKYLTLCIAEFCLMIFIKEYVLSILSSLSKTSCFFLCLTLKSTLTPSTTSTHLQNRIVK